MQLTPGPNELLIRISTQNSSSTPPGRAATFAHVADVVDALSRMMIILRDATGQHRLTKRVEFYPVAARVGSIELLLHCAAVVAEPPDSWLTKTMNAEITQALIELVTLIAGTLAIAQFPLQLYFYRAHQELSDRIVASTKTEPVDPRTLAAVEPLLRGVPSEHVLEVICESDSARVTGEELAIAAASWRLDAPRELTFLVIGASPSGLDVIADGIRGVAHIDDQFFAVHPQWRLDTSDPAAAFQLTNCVVKGEVETDRSGGNVWSIRKVIEVVDAAHGPVYRFDQP